MVSNLEAAACFGKEVFTDQRLARKVAKRMSKKASEVHVYRCRVCRNWHIGGAKRKHISNQGAINGGRR